MRRHEAVVLVVVAVAVGAVAFCAGRTMTARQRSREHSGRREWLRKAPAAVVQADRDFEQQARQWVDAVRAEQVALLSLLADPCSPREQVFAQVDRVVESHATLLRSVGRHLVQLRDSLPEPQERRLMQFCAHSLRGSAQRRYRWRGGTQDGGAGAPGRGGGRGAGRGRQYRRGRGEGHPLAHKLQLTQEQIAWVQQHDPDFDQQCLVLRDSLREAHMGLVASFDDEQTADEELLAQVDRLIEAHSSLERRVAEHVVALQPRLTQQQRQRLLGLCTRGRESGVRDAWPANWGRAAAFDIGLLSEPVLGMSI